MNGLSDSLEAALRAARAERDALSARLEALEQAEQKMLEDLRARGDALDARARKMREELHQVEARALQLERNLETALPARLQARKLARAALRFGQVCLLLTGLLMAPESLGVGGVLLSIPVNLAAIWSLGNYLDRAELSDV